MKMGEIFTTHICSWVDLCVACVNQKQIQKHRVTDIPKMACKTKKKGFHAHKQEESSLFFFLALRYWAGCGELLRATWMRMIPWKDFIAAFCCRYISESKLRRNHIFLTRSGPGKVEPDLIGYSARVRVLITLFASRRLVPFLFFFQKNWIKFWRIDFCRPSSSDSLSVLSCIMTLKPSTHRLLFWWL